MSNTKVGPGGAKLAHVAGLEPESDQTALYAKADGKLYKKTYGGSEQAIGGSVEDGVDFPIEAAAGDLFWRTSTNTLYRYDGASWLPAVQQVPLLLVQPSADGQAFVIKNAAGDTVFAIDTTTGDVSIMGRITCAGITNTET
jgi:hypothetical protein